MVHGESIAPPRRERGEASDTVTSAARRATIDGMTGAPRLDERFGLVRANVTVLAAALMAAHAAAPDVGFRASDVRFFVYVFANWLERDVLYPGEAMELTQVRRLLTRLLRLGHARRVARRATGSERGVRCALTPTGVAMLITKLEAAMDTRSFEEAVFVVTFVACYKPHLVAMLPADARKEMALALDPRKLLRRARVRVERVLRDLTERVASSARVAREAATLRRAGEPDASIAQRLEALGVYQLQHIRAFAGFILSFPPELRRLELGPAFQLRSQLLFETFADSARGQLRALERLDARLGSADALRDE